MQLGIVERQLCCRQMEFVQERSVSRIVVQVFQQGVNFKEDQSAVMLRVGAVDPLEGFVALIPLCVNSSD
jgi:hypothetical protein